MSMAFTFKLLFMKFVRWHNNLGTWGCIALRLQRSLTTSAALISYTSRSNKPEVLVIRSFCKKRPVMSIASIASAIARFLAKRAMPAIFI